MCTQALPSLFRPCTVFTVSNSGAHGSGNIIVYCPVCMCAADAIMSASAVV